MSKKFFSTNQHWIYSDNIGYKGLRKIQVVTEALAESNYKESSPLPIMGGLPSRVLSAEAGKGSINLTYIINKTTGFMLSSGISGETSLLYPVFRERHSMKMDSGPSNL